MATATPYTITHIDEHNDYNNKIILCKKILISLFLTAGWTYVIGLWSGDYMIDKSSNSFIFAICGFCLGVVGCLCSWYFKLGNFKQTGICNFVACLLFIILHYAKVNESIIYWTYGSIMLAGVAHIFLNLIFPLIALVCSVPRIILRGK
jgi:hypothetical protein